MIPIADKRFSVAEAAFVSGLSERVINNEIEQHVVQPRGRASKRRLSGADLLYFSFIGDVRDQMKPRLRKEVRKAISTAVEYKAAYAEIHQFQVSLSKLQDEIMAPFGALERMRTQHVETRKDVAGGEPVIKGTRIPVRHIADLVKAGETQTVLCEDFNLSQAQIEAALLYDRLYPRKGRPSLRQKRTLHVPAR